MCVRVWRSAGARAQTAGEKRESEKKRKKTLPTTTIPLLCSFFPHPVRPSHHPTMSTGKSEPPAAWKIVKPYLNGGLSG